jgi:molecular chaperone DnaK
MSSTIPIGIDLGTTFSAVAWIDETGHSAMLRNAEGDVLTPSVVLFNQTEVVVGKPARTATVIDPDLVAEWVKRDMGSPYYSRPIQGQYLPPEVIQACILRKLKSDIAATLTADAQVVITVPAYFDEPRRKATADAGEMAGLKVLDIVNEPTAGALAFGETLGYLSPGGTPKAEMTVLIYDLGGGTFDVTLLRLAPGNIETLATDGDVRLGGHDWDLRLVDYLAETFKKTHQLDFRQDPIAVNRTLAAVIEAKHTLSARNRAVVEIDYQQHSCEIPITRELFAQLTADLLERTACTTRQLLADAKLQWTDVTRLLLVGGSTRMPMVREMLQTMTGIEPEHTVSPDEAVARGAALYAGYLLGKRGEGAPPPNFEVSNVNSHSLGVEGIEPETLRKTNVILIPRNTRLPAKFTERFSTKTENQRSIVIQVLEGESSLPGECTAIGRSVIHNLPDGLPKGWPIEVTFKYAANGRLSVRASVPGTHQTATLKLERASGLSSAGVARWKQPIAAAAGFDAFEAMLGSVLGELKDTPTGTTGISLVLDAEAADVLPAPAAQSAQPETQKPTEAAGCSPVPVSNEETPAATDAEPWLTVAGQQPLRGLDAALSPNRRENAGEGPIPQWLMGLVGYATSAILGLALGYWLLSWLRPDAFPWPW